MIDERFIAKEDIDLSEYIICTYIFQTPIDPKVAAVELCKSQSTSSAGWGDKARVHGETDEVVNKFGAKLVSHKILSVSDKSDMPHVNDSQVSSTGFYTKVEVKMALPIGNLSDSIALLLTAAAGEIHYLPCFTSIQWIDVHFPVKYLRHFRGPKFGSDGIRELTETRRGIPLIIAVVKPSLCEPEQFAELVYEAAMGGADIVKEDELLVDIIASPLAQRGKLAIEAIRKAEKETGRRILYQPNITADGLDILKLYDAIMREHPSLLMMNGMAVGLPMLKSVAAHSKVPISSHFDLTACLAKVKGHGINHKVLAIIHRLAGVDNLIIPAFGNTMMEYEEDIKMELAMCSVPMGHLNSTFPFFGGGIKPTNIPYILKKAQTNDVGLILGHGIYGHPDGARAGAKAAVQARESYLKNIPLEVYAKDHPELARAIEYFGVYKEPKEVKEEFSFQEIKRIN